MTPDDPLSAFINNTAGGQAGDDAERADMLASLLQGLSGGAPSGTGDQDALGGTLAGMMGGQDTGGDGGMDDLLGSLLGGMGGGDVSGGGMGDMLGMLLGGMSGGGGMAQASFMAPLADSISAKVGIPRELVMMGLAFLLTKLMNSKQQGAGRSVSLADLDANEDGMAAEFAAQAGIDERQAAETLNALTLALSSGGY